MRGILPTTPLDFVDLLFYLQRFEIIEFGLVGLELGMKLVFASLLLRRVSEEVWWACPQGSRTTDRIITLEEDYPPTLISSC
jgi:hypothetical protein